MYAYSLPPPLPPTLGTKPRSSAVKAGWICIVAGICTVPVFGLGFLLLSVAIILSVVAMATHQIREGFCILLTALASMIVCWILVVAFIVDGTASILNKAMADMPKRQKAASLPPSTQAALHGLGPNIVVNNPTPAKARPMQLPVRLEPQFPNQVFNVAGAWGAKHEDLVAAFPDLETPRPGSTVIVNDWRGWKSVHLGFNDKSRLAAITFLPSQPMDLNAAKRIATEQFQFPPPPMREVHLVHAVVYRNIPGQIQTLNFGYSDHGRIKKVNEVSFFFNISWNE